MAEIQIEYSEGYCELQYSHFGCKDNYCMQCHTGAASDLGCDGYDEGEYDADTIPFGDCIHAKFRTKYKGMSVKRYEIEPFEDDYNPHLNCMILSTGRKDYYCDKIILDGKCIYCSLAERRTDEGD